MIKEEHSFDEMMKIGKEGEEKVNNYLLQYPGLEIEGVEDLPEQKKGIDFKVSLNGGKPKGIEVKRDNVCERNHRYFLEAELTNSKGKHHKDGWAHTTQSDLLFLLIGDTSRMLIVDPDYLRKNLRRWKQAHGLREARDKKGYSSFGICVPLIEIREALIIIDLDGTSNEVLDLLNK